MATVLYRLGRFAFHRRWLVIGAWVAVLGIVGIGASQLSGPTSETFSIPGTQSQQALDLLKERAGATADSATARVVVQAPDALGLGHRSPWERSEASALCYRLTLDARRAVTRHRERALGDSGRDHLCLRHGRKKEGQTEQGDEALHDDTVAVSS